MKNKAKILIVDDNRIIREVLRGLIRHDEQLHVVGVAANGESALEMIAQLKPDLVCCDILMPGIDGIAVLRAIHAAHNGTRVIVVSGESRPDIVSRALKAGASGFVVKPFNAEKVLRSIHAALAAPVPACEPEPEPEPEAELTPEEVAAVAPVEGAPVPAAEDAVKPDDAAAKPADAAPAEPAAGERAAAAA
jgi:two-component system chemotaxis response regulator CheY